MTFLDLLLSGMGPSCYTTHEPDGAVNLHGPVEDIRRAHEAVVYLTGVQVEAASGGGLACLYLPGELANARVPSALDLASRMRCLGGHLSLDIPGGYEVSSSGRLVLYANQ